MATTPQGFPYPLGTDRVMDGDDAIHALADAVGTRLAARMVAGQTVAALNNATSSGLAVTFPSGAFTIPPRVIAGVSTGNAAYIVQAGSITATGFTLLTISRSGTAVTVTGTGDWVAIQQ